VTLSHDDWNNLVPIVKRESQYLYTVLRHIQYHSAIISFYSLPGHICLCVADSITLSSYIFISSTLDLHDKLWSLMHLFPNCLLPFLSKEDLPTLYIEKDDYVLANELEGRLTSGLGFISRLLKSRITSL
jgi:hypothetical protein